MQVIQNLVRSGNATQDTADPALRKWLAGNFKNSVAPVPSSAVEMKWGIHNTGEERVEAQATADAKFTSLGILVRGRVSYWFKDERSETRLVSVQQLGDYVVWAPGVLHWWRIEEDDTLILTFRWVEPSTSE